MAYVVIHLYNPARNRLPVVNEEPIGYTNIEEEAEDYVERYNNPVVYDPAKQRIAHQLVIHEVEINRVKNIPRLDLREPPQTSGWFVADRLMGEY